MSDLREPITARILVVDDRQDSVDLFVMLLSTYLPGARVFTALNGASALAAAREMPPDLVILDVKMPGMDGYEVCRRLREDPVTRDASILMVSGMLVTPKHRVRGFEKGADGYLCKPFEPPEFIAQVHSLLRLKLREDALREHERSLEQELERRTRDLRASEDKLRTIYEHSPDAILVAGVDGVLLDHNASAAKLFGSDGTALEKASFFDLVDPAKGEEIRKHWAGWLRGNTVHFTGRCLGAGGRPLQVEIHGNRVELAGSQALLLHVRDLTERCRMEEHIARLNAAFLSFEISPAANIAKLVSLIRDMMNADGAVYYDLEDADIVRSGFDDEAEVFTAITHPREVFCLDRLGKTAKRGLLVFRGVDRETPPRHAEFVRRLGLQTHLAAPVRWGDRLVGMLCLLYRRNVEPDEAERRLVGIVATAIAVEMGRRLATRSLEESEENYRTLIETLPLGVLLVQEGRIVLANNAAGTMLNLPDGAALVGSDPFAYLPDDLQTGHPRIHRDRLAGREAPGRYETRLRRADGCEIMVEQYITLVRFRGQPATQLVGIDITDRKRAERELREAEEKYRSLVEQLPAITYITELADPPRIVYISPQIRALFGRPETEWLKNRLLWKQFVHPDDLAQVVRTSEEHDRTGEPLAGEYRMIRADGRTVWFREQAVYLPANGDTPMTKHGVMMDVTPLKEAEEALRESERKLLQAQKLEALGRLAGGVAHDFNNMLTSILVYSRMLYKMEDLDDAMRTDVAEILHAAERAAELTRQLLVFGRTQVVQMRPLLLNDVVSGIDRLLRRTLGEDVVLTTLLGENLPPVLADAGQLEQVIMNMAINARDAMRTGGKLLIQTSLVRLDKPTGRLSGLAPGSYVVCKIRDNGIGMPPEVREHIFEPFFTTKDVGEGTGLGLSTVYGIVQQHQGHIDVESEPGQGSCFRLYLPSSADALPVGEAGEEGALPGGSELVLVVEDEPTVRRLAVRLLKGLGYRVKEAGDGQEALALLEGAAPPVDLVLTDVVMPRLSGPELAAEIRRRGRREKVVFMTGFSQNAILHPEMTGTDYVVVTKPFTQQAIATALRQVLDAPPT